MNIGDADIANRLLQNFANINLKDKNGCTALHRSSEYGSYDRKYFIFLKIC